MSNDFYAYPDQKDDITTHVKIWACALKTFRSGVGWALPIRYTATSTLLVCVGLSVYRSVHSLRMLLLLLLLA